MNYYIRKFKKLFSRVKREWDFEGRCVECHKPLPLKLIVITQCKIQLEAQPCKEHPNDSMILWPQRDDIKRVN